MPELPEVEVLVRHLHPALKGKIIRSVRVYREKIVRPTGVDALERQLVGARILRVHRRAKYLLFECTRARETFTVAGHLGMTGRMFLLPAKAPLPRHVAVELGFGATRFVFEDTRYFGRFTLDLSALDQLGPEPWAEDFTPATLLAGLRRSRQPVKVKLLDQSLVAGVGNIYASEALFRARLSPRRAAARVRTEEAERLHAAIREVMDEAISFGSTVPLDFGGEGAGDGLFYYGRAAGTPDFYEERLQVYDRAGEPCSRCATPIRRIVQAARSTFYCPACQARPA